MENAKVWVAVLLITFIFSAVHILSKAAFDGGMSTFVFVFYRQLVATVFLLPLSFFLQRFRKAVPAMSFRLCLRIFILALLGITGNINLFCVALDYTSAALASETSNAIPVITFILAALLGMEKVKVKRQSGVAKLAGVGLCVAGVVTIAFYSGPRLKTLKQHSILRPHGNQKSPAAPAPSSSRKKWVLGTFIMMLANLSWSLWSVLQGPLLEDYPSQLLLTALQSLFSTLQTFSVALAIERDFSRWKLGFNLSLISVAYSGIMVSGVAYFLQSWIIQKKGPIFLTLMAPMTLIVTMILSYFILEESISLGSVLGGALIVGGLYSVLWGKRMEDREGEELPTASGDTKSPLEDQETAPGRDQSQ